MLFGFSKPNVQKMKEKRDVEGLIKALGHKKNFQVCSDSARALGEIGDKRAVEPLINALKDHQGWELSENIVWALGNVADKRAVEALIKARSHPSKDVRLAAAVALEKIGDSRGIGYLIYDLADRETRPYALREFMEIGTLAVEPLIKVMSDSNNYHRVRSSAAEALDYIGWEPGKDEIAAQYWILKDEWSRVVEIGEPAVEPLIKILNGDMDENNSNICSPTKAAIALSKICGSACYQDLNKALSDSDKDINVLPSETHNMIGGARSIEPLIEHLRRYKDAESAELLGKLGDQRAVGPLIEALGYYPCYCQHYYLSSEILVRRAAAESLIHLYKDKKIDQNAKSMILSAKILITTPHQDESIKTGAISDCTERHVDYGIGLDFPL